MTQRASTQRALRELVKSLSAIRAGRIGLVAIVAVVLVGAVWINALVGDAPSPGASSSSPASAAHEVSAGVSEAAYRAADRDASRGTETQRAHLDPASFERVTVRHVVDGDTLAVATESGDHVSVRLIGMDTPESVAPQEERNCEEGVLASDHMKELVGKGDVLWLQYDTSVTDKYDRPLAYVWRALPASAAEADDPAVIARDMLNAIQVIDGYGQAKTYRPDTYHDGLFAQWGDEALADARGVTHKWA